MAFPPQFYRKKVSNITHSLSNTDINLYRENGWIGNFGLLTTTGVNYFTKAYIEHVNQFLTPSEIHSLKEKELNAGKHWFKSVHCVIPEFKSLLSHPFILEKIKQILGPNILLWGSSVTIRRPGQSHRWHVDIEHTKWKGVTLFIGLAGASPKNSLNLISCSHTLRTVPQTANVKNSHELLALAKTIEQKCELINSETSEGEFMIFDGYLWHGSNNFSNNVRYSIIAQYCCPDQKTSIPLNWEYPID